MFQAPLAKQLDDATAAIHESTRPLPDAELLAQSPAATWREWLGRLALAARSGPVVVVLDEFPWLVGADPTLEGELQVQWDRTLAKLPVLLILIGSDVAMMDRLAGHGRPLFGRLSPLVVPALNPAEIAEAMPGRSAEEVFDAYLVTGGYPRLVSDLVNHGSRRVVDYVHGSLTDRTLTEVKGLIEREIPAWAPPSSKLRRYRVVDPYLRFWFRYVERYVDRIARGRSDLAVAAFDRDWETWRGQSVEPVVRDALLRLAVSDEHLAGVEAVQPWWVRDNSIEVDVVAMTSTSTALLAAIKWRSRGGVTAREIERLRSDRERVPRCDAALLAAVSPNGVRPKGADVAYSAEDLLAAWR